MMHTQVVDDKKDFLPGILHQPFEARDEKGAVSSCAPLVGG
jgi:hypothetical protein